MRINFKEIGLIVIPLFAFLGYYFFLQFVTPYFIPVRYGFRGESPFLNLDGVHYERIAEFGYSVYQQAFFPLYPVVIKAVKSIFHTSYWISAIAISWVALFGAVIMLYKLVLLDFDKKTAFWTILFLLFYPVAFYLYSGYTESLFLFLILSSFYFIRLGFKNNTSGRNFLISAIFAALSSFARLIGIFMVPSFLIELYEYLKQKKHPIQKVKFISSVLFPAGLIGYMVYLWKTYNDPLMFIHSQPAFGAGRSGGQIILLPQVIWRYIKIFATISPVKYDFWMAFLEFVTFFTILIILFLAYRRGIRKSYIVFSFLALVLPTLSGTFSSISRYTLPAFAIFIFFATIKNVRLKIIILLIFLLLQTILASLFFRGYFVS